MANILIVDDDPAVQATIRLVLERAGYRVATADGGKKALELFHVGAFDLIFLDIFMPGMDGLETMRLIRQERPDIPIIVISGRPIAPDSYSEPDFLGMATKLGAIASLPKPFKPAQLLAAVETSLASANTTNQPPQERPH